MDDPLFVSGLQALCRLDGDIESVLQLQRPGFDLLIETFAFKEGHRDEGASVLFSDFVNGTNVGMIQSGGGFRLALEAFTEFLVGDEMRGEEL